MLPLPCSATELKRTLKRILESLSIKRNPRPLKVGGINGSNYVEFIIVTV
nr:MAG TPA: hypothetical protein [Myoviridae sp. ctTS62]